MSGDSITNMIWSYRLIGGYVLEPEVFMLDIYKVSVGVKVGSVCQVGGSVSVVFGVSVIA